MRGQRRALCAFTSAATLPIAADAASDGAISLTAFTRRAAFTSRPATTLRSSGVVPAAFSSARELRSSLRDSIAARAASFAAKSAAAWRHATIPARRTRRPEWPTLRPSRADGGVLEAQSPSTRSVARNRRASGARDSSEPSRAQASAEQFDGAVGRGLSMGVIMRRPNRETND